MQPQLAIIIKYLEPGLIPGVDYVIRDNSDGQGPFIAEWNVGTPAQPTQTQIAAARDAALAENLNNKNIKLRKQNGPSEYKMSLALISQVEQMIQYALITSTPEMQEVIDEIAAVDVAYPVT